MKISDKLNLKGYYSEIFLMIILLFALILRLIFFTGLNFSDDTIYRGCISQMLNGTFHHFWFMDMRIMLLYPMTVFAYLLGISDFSIALWPLSCSLGSIIVIFKIGDLLFNKNVGLLAAFLLSFFPLDTLYATRIMPDVPLAFFVNLSVLLFLFGEKRIKDKGFDSSKPPLFYFLSGIALGLAYLVKVSGVILFFFYFLYISIGVLRRKKGYWGYALIVVGFLLVFAVEGCYYHTLKGDFLLRYHSITRSDTLNKDCGWCKGVRPVDILCFYPPVMLHIDRLRLDINGFHGIIGGCATFPTEIFGLFYYLVIISLLYLFFKRIKKSYVLILWLVSLFAYMSVGPRNFGSLFVGEYLIIGKEIRYLTMITVPSLLILACFICRLRKVYALIIIFLLLGTSIYLIDKNAYDFNWETIVGNRRKMDIVQIKEYLEKKPDRSVYCNRDINDYLRFFFGHRKDKLIKDIESVKSTDEIKDSYVILNGTWSDACDKRYQSQFPEFMTNPPDKWILLKIIPGKDGNLNRTYNPLIYYAPP